MKVAVIQFPGSNCDQDGLFALREDVGVAAEYVWHDSESLAGFDGVFIPGGFTYGDYLRCGAMAARAPIMSEVNRFAADGKPVLGVCNGFQILCEAGLLPGTLLPNIQQQFSCRDVTLVRLNKKSIWTERVPESIRIPIAHGEGRYYCDDETLTRIRVCNQIAFCYEGENPNGSLDSIAGVLSEKGNVLGLMPHPERATKTILGGTDGLFILMAFSAVCA